MINWLKKRKNLGLVAVALALVLAVVAGSCAPAKPVVKERVVKIGVAVGFTGPLASIGVHVSSGMLDPFEYMNKEGGVDGVKFKVSWRETQIMPAPTVPAYMRFKEMGALCVFVAGSSQNEILAPRAPRDEIVVVLGSAGWTPLQWTSPVQWLFCAGTGEGLAALTAIEWFKKEMGKPSPKVGLLVWDYGSGHEIVETVKKNAPRMGFELVGWEMLPPGGLIDTSAEWLRLAGKKPDMVYGLHYGAGLTTMVKDAARLGIRKKGITLMGSELTMDNFMWGIVGEDGLGWKVNYFAPAVKEWESPLREEFAEFVVKDKRRYSSVEEIPGAYSVYCLTPFVIKEALRLAIEKVGFENLDGRALREGMVSITDYSTGIVPPITVRDDHPFFTTHWGLYEMGEGGKMKRVGEWATIPFLPER